jgi:hypothetical protein
MWEEMRLIPKLMEFLSNIRSSVLTRYTWVLCCVSILFLGFGTFLVEPDGSGFPNILLSLMILLSFPSGLGLFIVTWPFIDINPPVDFFLIWLGVFLVGYFQWFHLVSNLKGGLITLSLAQVEPAANAKHSAIKDPVPHKVIVNRKRAVRIVHFDALGRTPLERAISSTSRKSSQRFTVL